MESLTRQIHYIPLAVLAYTSATCIQGCNGLPFKPDDNSVRFLFLFICCAYRVDFTIVIVLLLFSSVRVANAFLNLRTNVYVHQSFLSKLFLLVLNFDLCFTSGHSMGPQMEGSLAS